MAGPGERMSEYRDVRKQVVALLRDGNAADAFAALRPVLRYPGPADEPQWPDALALLARVSEQLAGPEWARHVHAAARDPNDVDALYGLGYQLVEQSLDDVAASVLARANRLAPGQPGIVSELAVALEGAGLNAEACRVLTASPEVLRDSAMCRYLLAFDTLMSGDVAGARAAVERVRPDDESIAVMADQVRQMIRRADAIGDVAPLDDHDLRGWHLVVTASLLLHVSPHGFEQGMRGRYAFVQDSESLLHEGIRRLATALDAWQVRPPRVLLVTADRDSHAAGLALADVLGVPAQPLARDPVAAGVVVAYDLGKLPLETLELLAGHRPGQVLWSQAASWTDEPPFAADATTFLYQYNLSPWEAGRLSGDASGGVARAPAVEGTPRQLAGAVLAADPGGPDALADLEFLAALAERMASLPPTDEAAFGAFRTTGPRRRQRTDSPVKSSRFT